MPYSRAYRDPRSPLAPLTPRSNVDNRNIFNFNCNQPQKCQKCHRPQEATAKMIPNHQPKLILQQIQNKPHQQGGGVKVPQMRPVRVVPKVQQPGQFQASAHSTVKSNIIVQKAGIWKDPVFKPAYNSTVHQAEAPRKAPIKQDFITPSNKEASTKRVFRPVMNSTMVPPPLSPRVAKILKSGNLLTKYGKKFQQEEIDLKVLMLLSPTDYRELGIENEDRKSMLSLAASLLSIRENKSKSCSASN